MRGGSDRAILDGGLFDVVAARGRPFRHGHAPAPTPLPLNFACKVTTSGKPQYRRGQALAIG